MHTLIDPYVINSTHKDRDILALAGVTATSSMIPAQCCFNGWF